MYSQITDEPVQRKRLLPARHREGMYYACLVEAYVSLLTCKEAWVMYDALLEKSLG